MFSCHATKVFHTIEGGIVVFRERESYEIIDSLTNFGYDGPEEVVSISTNARMNEFEACMGLCNLRHINDEIEKRKLVYERYIDILNGVDGIYLIPDQAEVSKNYAYLPVFFDGYKYNRDDVQKKLQNHNIFARKYFFPIVPDLACYKNNYAYYDVPISRKAANSVLCLPLYAGISIDEIEFICKLILE